MADYSMVRDATGAIRGVWLKDPDDFLRDPNALMVLATVRGLPADTFAQIAAKDYRVVRNTYDNAGGSFVMFGSARAPGER